MTEREEAGGIVCQRVLDYEPLTASMCSRCALESGERNDYDLVEHVFVPWCGPCGKAMSWVGEPPTCLSCGESHDAPRTCEICGLDEADYDYNKPE